MCCTERKTFPHAGRLIHYVARLRYDTIVHACFYRNLIARGSIGANNMFLLKSCNIWRPNRVFFSFALYSQALRALAITTPPFAVTSRPHIPS